MFSNVNTYDDLVRPQWVSPYLTEAAEKKIDKEKAKRLKSLGVGPLDDRDYDNELYKKYAHFFKCATLYETATRAWAWAAYVLSAGDFDNTGPALLPAREQIDLSVAVGMARKAVQVPSPRLWMQGSDIIAGVNFPNIRVNLTLGSSEALADCERIIGYFIKGFKLPQQWKRVDVIDEKTKKVTGVKAMPVFPVVRGEAMTLEAMSEMKVKFSPQLSPSMRDTKLTIPQDYKPFTGVMHYQFEIDPQATLIDSRYIDTEAAAGGNFKGMETRISISIKVNGQMHFPLEYALWATAVTDDKEFLPLDFSTLINSRSTFHAAEGRRSRPKPPSERVAGMNDVQRIIREVTEEGVRGTNRLNQEGFVILKDGDVSWIPDVNNVDKYLQLVRSAYDPKKGELIPPAKIPGLPNSPVLTDWLTLKHTFTDDQGYLNVVDLAGARKLDAVTIRTHLEWKLADGIGLGIGMLLDAIHKKTGLFNQVKGADDRLANPIAMITWLREDTDEEITLKKLANPDRFLSPEDVEAKGRIYTYCKTIGWAMAEVWKQFDKIDSDDLRYADRIRWARYTFALVGHYGRDYDKFNKAANDAIALNQEVGKPLDPKKPIELYNMPGLSSLMPHQAKAERMMEPGSPNIIYDVAPGGGKTILNLIDIGKNIVAKRIRRPIVIGPKNLVREWTREIYTISQGQINAFPLQIEQYRTLRSIGWEDKDIIKMLEQLPINTIVMCDFNFLKSGSADLVYGPKVFSYYPIAMMLASVGFDFCAVDESQKAKNEESQINQALTILTSGQDWHRLASGTIVHKDMSDIPGQMRVINAAAFTTKNAFNSRFGASTNSGGSVTQWTDTSRSDVRKIMLPYTRQVVMKRREWAFLLPTIYEDFHKVELTRAQKDFYDKQMADILEEIKADPKIKELLKKGGEEAAAALENELRRYFAKVEIFINAPDANMAFVSQTGITKEDLISPKVKKVNDLITVHFKGGQLPGATKDDPTYQADPNKIIIFGYNKDVSKHIFKYLSPQHQRMAVHYSAGNMEELDSFRTNPNIKIIVADEASIKEGFNLQMASRMIRLQTLWTPGDQEQALSRVMRPDPRGLYNREWLYFDWVLTNNTLEIAKTARMISRIIDKARYDEEMNPRFRPLEDEFRKEEVKLISMNLDILKEYSEASDLAPFYRAYGKYKSWEDGEFELARTKLKEDIEKRLGRKIKDEEVRKLAMLPVDGNKIIQGSRPHYCPWLPGATPPDPMGLGLKALEELDEADDDEDEGETKSRKTQLKKSSQEIVGKGDLVITEFGPGYVVSLLDLSVRVRIPGMGTKPILLSKKVVYKPMDKKKADALAKQLRANQQRGMLTPGAPKPKNLGTEDNPEFEKGLFEDTDDGSEEVEKEDSRSPKDKAPKKGSGKEAVELHVSLLNGQGCIWAVPVDGETTPKILVGRSYHEVGRFVYTKPPSAKAFNTYLENLETADEKKKIRLTDKFLFQLDKAYKMMKARSNKLDKVGARDVKVLQEYWKIDHKKPNNPKEIRPYVMVWDGEIHICFNKATQPISAIRTVLAPGMKYSEVGPVWMKFFGSRRAMEDELQKLQDKGLNIVDIDATRNEMKSVW